MLQQVDHVNLVVRDMPTMLAFYRDILGMKVTKEAVIQGDWIDAVVGLRQVEAEVIYLELESGARIELLRFRHPEGSLPPGLGDANTLGLRHVAFRVQGIAKVVDTLSGRGVRFFGPVQVVPDSQVTYAGGVRKRLVYFHDPEGNLLEICSYESSE